MQIAGRSKSIPCLISIACLGLFSAVNAQVSPFIYGIHDHDTNIQEYLDHFSAGGVTGWVTATIAIGSNPNDTGGDDFRWIANQGHSVIVRLNNGYCGTGNIPTPDKYDDFAQRAAHYVAATQGADIFIIGNETNLAVEWPPVNGHAQYVSPQDYASLFRKTYDAIKAVRPGAQVITQALAPFAGPFSAGSTCGFTHDANPLNWVQYMNQMLTEIKSTGGIDGIALHINSRGYTYNDIHSTQKVNAGGQDLYFSFYVYKDWVDHGIPADLYHLPLYATESNGIFYWSGGHPENPGSHYEPGWMQEVYAEIDRYNQQAATSGKPVYRAVNMYRWCAWCDGWNINNSPYKGQILSDLDQAITARYRWPDGATTPPPPPPPKPLPDGDNVALNSVNWSASSSFNGDFDGSRAYDGVIAADSKWTSNGSSAESWLALDLGGEFDVSGFIVRHAGAGGEPGFYNTESYRLESGDSLSGPWTSLATVNNATQENSTTSILATSETTRFVRLYISDAGVDHYARIPEFEVYATAAVPPPPPPGNLLDNGDFENGLHGWTVWNQRGNVNASVDNGALQLGSADHNGGLYQQFDTGGPGTTINVSGFWASQPTKSSYQWAEVLIINGSRLPSNGEDVSEADADVVLIYKNDTWASPGGWSGAMDQTAPVANPGSFVASGDVATIILKSGNAGGSNSGTRYDDVVVEADGAAPPPPPPPPEPVNQIVNGNFDDNLGGWTVWNQRGNVNATVSNGALRLASSNHNGGVYQQFNTGGPGTTVNVSGFWESNPTQSQAQWAEVLVIDGSRLPLNGEDVSPTDADVVMLYKNDTWTSAGGWSGSMNETSPVANVGSFVASGDVATIILKSGNAGGANTGTTYDDIFVEADGTAPPPPPTNSPPAALAGAKPVSGTAPLAVNFDATGSSDPDGDALHYSWSFGDGSSATGSVVSHTYNAAGNYAATLTVEDGNGGSDSDTVTITVTTTAPPPGNGQQWVVLERKRCNGPCDFNQIRADLTAQGKDIGFVKIGFHVAPNGNQNGLGDWERTLHNAGVPFFLKSVDSAGQIFEAVQLKAASGCIDNSRDGGSTSCVPHQLVFRRSVTGQDYRPDVPYSGSPDCANPPPADTPYQQIYNETPYDAAVAHWQRHRDEFPPELLPYKHLIWVETINEINRGGNCDFDGDGVGGEPFPHNVGLIDPVFGQYTKEGEWIAEFAIHTANLAMAEGFNWAAFGWSSGEPEIGTWAGPKMREYLQLIAANPDRAALATHEYSYTTDGLELAYPSLLGRFQEVFDVADHYGFSRPTIVITEFGWTLNDIPGVHQSMTVDLPWAAELYAPHHEIQGAAIWYLGGGWEGIDQEVQQLIAPLTDYALSTYFELGPAGRSGNQN